MQGRAWIAWGRERDLAATRRTNGGCHGAAPRCSTGEQSRQAGRAIHSWAQSGGDERDRLSALSGADCCPLRDATQRAAAQTSTRTRSRSTCPQHTACCTSRHSPRPALASPAAFQAWHCQRRRRSTATGGTLSHHAHGVNSHDTSLRLDQNGEPHSASDWRCTHLEPVSCTEHSLLPPRCRLPLPVSPAPSQAPTAAVGSLSSPWRRPVCGSPDGAEVVRVDASCPLHSSPRSSHALSVVALIQSAMSVRHSVLFVSAG